jgi:murein DD-endopeptidase MepM/ murein hydrolase activator NlpD
MPRAPAYRPALGATAVDTSAPVAGRPQPPIYPLIVGNNGAYKAVRSSSAQGSCGVHGYPCQHPGVDVNGAMGTEVHAPESGVIVAVANGAVAPFSGYGPWLVVIRGDSGKYHLLGHLDPASASWGPVNTRVTAGDVIGRTSNANHTHWEVRTRLTPPAGQTNFDNNMDPVAWLSLTSVPWGTIAVLGSGLVLLALIARRQGVI